MEEAIKLCITPLVIPSNKNKIKYRSTLGPTCFCTEITHSLLVCLQLKKKRTSFSSKPSKTVSCLLQTYTSLEESALKSSLSCNRFLKQSRQKNFTMFRINFTRHRPFHLLITQLPDHRRIHIIKIHFLAKKPVQPKITRSKSNKKNSITVTGIHRFKARPHLTKSTTPSNTGSLC